jgi:hypothetical protein
MKLKRGTLVIRQVDPSPPFYDPIRDGVTFSLLSTWSACREKARKSLQGWSTKASGMGLTFGTITHELLQRIYEDVRLGKIVGVPSAKQVKKYLAQMETLWRVENPVADVKTLEYFELTMLLLESLMPLYFQHWVTDFTERKWEKVEREFKIPLTLTHMSGRVFTTFLRGKMDGSFRLKGDRGPRLLETKTKVRIEEETIVDILPFERQVNTYLLALEHIDKQAPVGVLYNIIRRPGLHQKKDESLTQFAVRIVADVKARPDWYFMRYEMVVEEKDLDRFRAEIHDHITDFLAWWYGLSGHWKESGQCQNVYGTCPYLSACSANNFTALFKRERVFRELEDL